MAASTLEPTRNREASLRSLVHWTSLLLKNARDIRAKSTQRLGQRLRGNIPIVIMCTVFVLLSVTIDTIRYERFLDGYDFSVFSQSLWQLSHFHVPHSTLRNVDVIFGDHFHPIISVLVPFYWLFETPKVLIYAQAILVSLSILPVYLFAKRHLGVRIGTLIASCYAISTGVQYMVYFEFHEIAFAVPLLAFALYYIDIKRWRPVYICACLLLLTKEDLALLLVFVGIYLLLAREVRRGLILMGVGLFWFLMLFLYLMPTLANRPDLNYWHMFYRKYGNSPVDAAANYVKSPIHMVKMTVHDMASPSQKRQVLYHLLAPFLFIAPLISPYIILITPLLLLRFMSCSTSYWQYDLHYGALPAVIITFATIDTFRRLSVFLQNRGMPPPRQRQVLTFIAIIMVFLGIRATYRYSTPFQNLENQNYYRVNAEAYDTRDILRTIPKDASVTAQKNIVPTLSNRSQIYILVDRAYWNRSDRIEVTKLPDTQYVVLNDSLLDSQSRAKFSDTLQDLISIGYHVAQQNEGGWYILSK